MQTFKDLRKVIGHVTGRQTNLDQQPPRKKLEVDEKTVLLLDDSPLKALYQPWNQLVIPEFDKQEFADSKGAAVDLLRNPDALVDGMDEILLAVVGVLETLRTVTNVPAWIRAGGLTTISADEAEQRSVEEQIKNLALDPEAEPTLETLPSHESFVHWFSTPAVLAHWTQKGREALERRGIKVSHGYERLPDVANARKEERAPREYITDSWSQSIAIEGICVY